MPRAERQRFPAWLVLLLALPGGASALTSDRGEPVYIEADQATLNEQQGSSNYEGNVLLRQGTLRLSGERMTVQLRDDRLETVTLEGSPARFAQRPDNADSDQEAEAEYIEYNAGTRQLLLERDAVVRQVGKEEFSSDRIEFNLTDHSVSAGGTDGRVRITLQPRHPDAAPETTPGADTAPAAEAVPGTDPRP